MRAPRRLRVLLTLLLGSVLFGIGMALTLWQCTRGLENPGALRIAGIWVSVPWELSALFMAGGLTFGFAGAWRKITAMF